MPVTYKSRLPSIERKLRPKVNRAVKATTVEIAAKVKATAPEDSGSLKKSIGVYPVDEMERRYSLIQYAEKEGPIHPEPEGESEAWGVSSLYYYIYTEWGTVTNPKQKKPFMVPAAESERSNFGRRVKHALRDL